MVLRYPILKPKMKRTDDNQIKISRFARTATVLRLELSFLEGPWEALKSLAWVDPSGRSHKEILVDDLFAYVFQLICIAL